MLCFVVVMQSFIMNSHEVFIHINQGCFAGTGAIVRLPQCQWSKRDGYGKVSQCITTTKHSKAKTVCRISWDILYHGIGSKQRDMWSSIIISVQPSPVITYVVCLLRVVMGIPYIELLTIVLFYLYIIALIYGPCMIVPQKWTKICWLATTN